MARKGSVIVRAVVEQEIRFYSESSFESYINQLDYSAEPYKIVSKTYNQDGLIVIIRKRYGEYPFLGEIDPCSISSSEIDLRDELRGATRDDAGVLTITDLEKYRRWEEARRKKSRY